MRIFGSFFLLAALASARTEFWAPAAPPRAHYAIDVKFVPETSRLEGAETIRLRNDTRRPIGRVALEWSGDVLRAEEGSLYPALHRMEEAGWIRAQWTTKENGRRARMYELTAAGKKQLDTEESRWQAVTTAVNRVLRTV